MSNDDERRKKFWDDQEKTDTGLIQNPKKSNVDGRSDKSDSIQNSAVLDKKIHEARVLMEQIHQLYQQFFNGVERRTPIEKVRLLESKIQELQKISVNLTAARFKISQFLYQYSQMKELWERKLRERERK